VNREHLAQTKKGNATTPRREARGLRVAAANRLKEWLSDRFDVAVRRKVHAKPAHWRSSGHGVSQTMAAITIAPPQTLVGHTPGTTYVNPARDLRRGRRLRAELR
jgi:hypothetical protein